MYFSAFCPTHGRHILMTRRNLVALQNGPDGPALHWRCSCGDEGVLARHAAPAR